MPLSTYTVSTERPMPVVFGGVPRVFFRSVSSNNAVIGRPENLYDRYVAMYKFRLTVRVQNVLSQGHLVDFLDAQGKRVSGGISDASGVVLGIFGSSEKVTAVIYDKEGGDSYNAMMRRDLQPVRYAIRGVDDPA